MSAYKVASVDTFFDEIIGTYGSQVFEVLPENLHMTLVDMQRRMDEHGLLWPVPSAVAEAREIPAEEGDVELMIYPSLTGNWVVAVFPIFSED